LTTHQGQTMNFSGRLPPTPSNLYLGPGVDPPTNRNHPQSCKARRAAASRPETRKAEMRGQKPRAGVWVWVYGSERRNVECCKLPQQYSDRGGAPDRKLILQHSRRRKCVRTHDFMKSGALQFGRKLRPLPLSCKRLCMLQGARLSFLPTASTLAR